MEPQGTPTPSEQPNNGAQEPTQPVENVQPAPSLSAQPSEHPQPHIIHPATWSSTDTSQAAPEEPVNTVQPAAQPMAGTPEPSVQPVVGAPASLVPPAKPKKRWFLPAALVAAALVLGGGGYAFAFYLPNRPSAIYASSLNRTGKALDTLINYSNAQTQKHYKSYSVDGKLTVTADGTNFDATLKGSMDADANTTATLDADVMGQHVNADLRSIHVADSASPDVYVRVSGIKSALDAAGAGSLDGLDGQWLTIDHTLLNSYAANYSSQVSMATNSLPTAAQSQDALLKVQAVNKQYIFTTDSTHAVLQDKKYIGKETKDGHSVYHYNVGYNKAHLKSYIGALGTALDGSSLNSWSKKANDGKTLSETLDVNSLKTSIDGAKTNYTFDVWVDTKTKLVQSVTLADPSDPSTTFTLAQSYASGTSYPFTLSYQGKADDGTPESASLKLTVDTSNNKETGVVAVNAPSAKIGFNFTVTPSASGVQVAAPSGAKSVLDLLSGLGLGSF